MPGKCVGCPFFGRTSVWSEGPLDAPIRFVGQSPGATEAEKGRPFVGEAGQRLDVLLKQVGLPRQSVLITNVVKCFVPAGSTIPSDVIERCGSAFLPKEIEGAKVIVTLGVPASEFVRKQELFLRASGMVHLFPMVHPAAAKRRAIYEARLRRQTAQLKRLLERKGFIHSSSGTQEEEDAARMARGPESP